MPGTAAKVTITERQQQILESIVLATTATVRLIQRARIILLAFDKKDNQAISQLVGLNPLQVGLWRRRWQARWEHLIQLECTQSHAALRRAIEKVLADAPRKGRDCTFTTEQQAAIIAIACEEPDEQSELPISHWTHQEIADEATRREVVPSISASTVRAFLKSGRSSTPSRQVLAQCLPG